MEKRGNKLIILFILAIVILLAALVCVIYLKVQAENKISSLEGQVVQLNSERDSLSAERDNLIASTKTLQDKYDLLQQDVAKIYKGCIKENACKGRYPGVSWYCNNVGDEVTDPSHTCVCDASCNLNATAISE